jgi:NAD(P)-dependent dehydrogenase (short-subunit alcohol dehydrogenase family)
MTETPLAPGDGKVAVVTGAGRGIGRAIALALAAQGWRVAGISRTPAELTELCDGIAAAGGEAIGLTASVTDEPAMQGAVASVIATWGQIDLLVNNAGTHNGVGPTWGIDTQTWWGDIEVSVLGPFICTKAVAPAMIGQGSGRIVNISSGAASEPRPYSSGYTAAKTAAQRWSESIAGPFGEHGVKVFSLNPGPVLTPMNQRNRDSEAYRKWYPNAGTMQYLPIELAVNGALFLASGAGDSLAGRYVTVFDDIPALAVDERLADPMFLTLRISR